MLKQDSPQNSQAGLRRWLSLDLRIYAVWLLVILDQASKWWAGHYLAARSIHILPVLQFALAHNRGAAFSFLAHSGHWTHFFFIALSMTAIAFVLYEYFYKPVALKMPRIASTLLLAGIFGNLYDRLSYGYVIDFIALHWHQWYWPVFNLADTALCMGMACFCWNFYQHRYATQLKEQQS